jgi:hypothetical protein
MVSAAVWQQLRVVKFSTVAVRKAVNALFLPFLPNTKH